MPRAHLRVEVEFGKEGGVAVFFGVGRGQQFAAVEDGVRARHEAQRLHLFVHAFPPGGEAHRRLGHEDAGNGDDADEIEGFEVVGLCQRRAFDAHQLVYRYAFRRRVEVGEFDQHGEAVVFALAHTEDAAGADFHPRTAHVFQGVQAVVVVAGGDDFAVVAAAGVEVVVVVIESGVGEGLRLVFVEHAEGHAGFQPQRLDPPHDFHEIRHVFFFGVAPRRAHAKAGCALVARAFGGSQDFINFQKRFARDTGVVTRALRAVFAVFRAGAGFDGQQGADLDLARVVVRAVYGLRLVEQFHEGQLVERLRAGEGPAGHWGAMR